MKKKYIIPMLLFGILMGMIGLGITLYPLIGNYLSVKNKSTVLTEYAQTVDKLEDNSIMEMLAAAQEYNNTLMPGLFLWRMCFQVPDKRWRLKIITIS